MYYSEVKKYAPHCRLAKKRQHTLEEHKNKVSVIVMAGQNVLSIADIY